MFCLNASLKLKCMTSSVNKQSSFVMDSPRTRYRPAASSVESWTVWPDVAISRHLGDFPRPSGAFFFKFIYCWALFGQNSYLLVAIFSWSLFTVGRFFVDNWALFHSNYLVTLGLLSSWLTSWPLGLWPLVAIFATDCQSVLPIFKYIS